MNEGLIVLAMVLGALGSGTAGWWDSHEPFDWRKFMGTVWRAVFAAMLGVMTFQVGELAGWKIYVAAFLAGAGVDVIGNRLQGAVNNKPSVEERLAELQSALLKLSQERAGQPPTPPASSPEGK